MAALFLRQFETGRNWLLATIALAAVAGPLAIHLALPSQAIAQRTAAPLQFEVASVKLAANQDMLESRPKRSTGRFRWTTQMIHLLGYAYHMEWWRISGDDVPFEAIYEIDATADPKASEDQVRLMLQSLLFDRFKMKVHREPKDAQGYALSVAKGGPKMQEAEEGHLPGLPDWMSRPPADPTTVEELVLALMPSKGVGAIIGRRANMLQLTETLQRQLSTAVFDHTELSGRYYFGFRYATDEDPEIPYPDLFAAIKEIGLRLEKHKGPVEMLVVDHMEKVPTEN